MAAAPGLFVRRSPRGSAGQGSAESRLRAPGWQSGRRLDVANAPQAGFDNPSAATGASVVKRGSFTSRRLSAPSTSLPLKPASIESSRSNGILRRASLPTPGSKPLRRPAPGEETAALSPGTAVTSLLGYRERRKQRHGPTVADEPPLQAELAKDLPEIGELRVEAEESGNIAEEWHDQQLSVIRCLLVLAHQRIEILEEERQRFLHEGIYDIVNVLCRNPAWKALKACSPAQEESTSDGLGIQHKL
eukprot:g17968.t1